MNCWKVNLGRGNGIIVEDITCSRKQAQICCENDGIYLRDLDSKFLTVVKKDGESSFVVGEKPIKLQLGRVLMTINLRN